MGKGQPQYFCKCLFFLVFFTVHILQKPSLQFFYFHYAERHSVPLKPHIFFSVLDVGIVFLTVQLGVSIFLTVQNSPASILPQWLISWNEVHF
jgi:hypothetical protein